MLGAYMRHIPALVHRSIDVSRASVLFCLLLLVCAVMAAAPAPAASSAGIRQALPNDISIELLGRSGFYTFGYQRMIGNPIGLEAGLSALGGGTSDNNATVVFVPLGVKLYLIPNDGSVYLTGGVVLVTASFHSSLVPAEDNEDDKSGSYSYLGLGMEYRSKAGLLFRGTAYGLIAGGGFVILPGLTAGYAF